MGKYYPNTEQYKDRQRQDDLRSNKGDPLEVTLYKFLRYHSIIHIVGLCPTYFPGRSTKNPKPGTRPKGGSPKDKSQAPNLRVSGVNVEDSGVSYQVFENMNRRTAEHGTAEYRSEKHCLIPFKNFCCSKFLVRYSDLKNSLAPSVLCLLPSVLCLLPPACCPLPACPELVEGLPLP